MILFEMIKFVDEHFPEIPQLLNMCSCSIKAAIHRLAYRPRHFDGFSFAVIADHQGS